MTLIATDVDDSIEKLRGKLAAELTQPKHALDPYFYRSHLVHDRELEHLIFRSWVYALHDSEIPNKGDFQLLEIGEDSIIIARDDQGDIHAMHNICRHRGSAVCEEPCGNRKTFVCPYHGWVYNLDGSMRAAREMHVVADFSEGDHGLKKIQLVN
ncbi:MAG: Rieske (2Fe-2S) protein, partial [Pseudomonadales bacterium]